MVAKSALCVAALAALSAVAGQNASAAVIPVTSYNADGIVQNGSANANNEGEIVVGQFSTNHRVVVYPFQLPTLAPGEVVTDASLKVVYRANLGTENFNVDVYAVDVNASNAISNGYYGVGASPTTPTGSVLIQDNFVTPTTTIGNVTSNATAGANLAAYLNQPGKYVAGSYVWLRLNFDVAQGSEVGQYKFGANDFGGGTATTAGSIPAVLTLTTAIPEPATVFVLAGVAGVLGLSRRRRPAGVK